jgi:hypothetical protein
MTPTKAPGFPVEWGYSLRNHATSLQRKTRIRIRSVIDGPEIVLARHSVLESNQFAHLPRECVSSPKTIKRTMECSAVYGLSFRAGLNFLNLRVNSIRSLGICESIASSQRENGGYRLINLFPRGSDSIHELFYIYARLRRLFLVSSLVVVNVRRLSGR